MYDDILLETEDKMEKAVAHVVQEFNHIRTGRATPGLVDGVKVAIVTDLGYMPASVRDHIRDCDVLMVESNHDLEMLRVGRYPWSVKQRVMSRVGHLSNAALAEFFASDYDGNAAFVVLAHLSEENNHPEIARDTAERALAHRRNLLQNRLMLASQWQALESIRL